MDWIGRLPLLPPYLSPFLVQSFTLHIEKSALLRRKSAFPSSGTEVSINPLFGGGLSPLSLLDQHLGKGGWDRAVSFQIHSSETSKLQRLFPQLMISFICTFTPEGRFDITDELSNVLCRWIVTYRIVARRKWVHAESWSSSSSPSSIQSLSFDLPGIAEERNCEICTAAKQCGQRPIIGISEICNGYKPIGKERNGQIRPTRLPLESVNSFTLPSYYTRRMRWVDHFSRLFDHQ